MAWNDNIMNVTTGANFIPLVWSKEAVIATEANLVYRKRLWKFDVDLAKGGNAVRIPNVFNLSSSSKTANTAVTLSTNTATVTNLACTTQDAVAVLIEDIEALQASYPIAQMYSERMGYAIAKAIDTGLATQVASLSQTVGTFNTDTIDHDDLLRAIQYLDDADAPQEDRSFIFQPAIKAALLKNDKFVLAMNVGRMTEKAPILTGQIGEVYGVPVFVSTNVYSTGDSVSNALVHKYAIASAVQNQMSVKSERKEDYIGTLYVANVVHGSAITRDTFGVNIKS